MSDHSITSLIEKLEGAEVGSRELNREIALRLESKLWLVSSGRHKVERNGRAVNMPAYSTSLDAALALAERFWPGQEYEITTLYGVARVTLNMNHGDQAGPHYGHNDCGHAPSAICAAILRAQSEARV